ncbi:MAG TPA: ABC transporter ATP-binding protein [Chloroflexota bacterium]|jgi:peptide/nickel transport system ATP-binding protein|nr:ABC transporter ATP-binding protein [Chloroflexota bacterium]
MATQIDWAPTAMQGRPIVRVEQLKVRYSVPRGAFDAVDDVSLTLYQGELFGLVGESGCGKSTLAYALLNMVPSPGRIAAGHIRFGLDQAIDITRLRGEALRRFRWKDAAMVFQSALNTLNPVMRIRDQVIDTVLSHERVSAREALDRATEGLQWVRLDPARVLHSYPHELSGGMKQRVSIMMALLLRPKLLILDEPTTALDVLSQRAILQILKEIRRRLGLTMLFITHDLALISEIADRVGVMYAGRLVEIGTLRDIFYHTHHPYSRALVRAVPTLSGDLAEVRPIPGSPPNLLTPPPGCRFHPRCPLADELTRRVEPSLIETEPGHFVACHHWRELV